MQNDLTDAAGEVTTDKNQIRNIHVTFETTYVTN